MDFYILTKTDKRFTYHTSPNTTVLQNYRNSPYTARARSFEHALEHGATKIVVIMNPVLLLHRSHWNGRGPMTEARNMTEAQHHGLWVYMDRLLNRYSHVYVPPLAWCRPWKRTTTAADHVTHINNPTLPMVAGYRVSALRELSAETRMNVGVGQALVQRGHDSFTMSDYFFLNHGAEQIDEVGSATTWARDYERAISRLA